MERRRLTILTLGPVKPLVTVAGVIVDGFHAFSMATARPRLARGYKQIRQRHFSGIVSIVPSSHKKDLLKYSTMFFA